MKTFLLSFLLLANVAFANFSGSWKFIDATSDIYIDIEENEESFIVSRLYIWHPFISFEKTDDIVLTKNGNNFIYKGKNVGDFDQNFFDIAFQDSDFSLILYGSRRENNELYILSFFDIFEIDGVFALVE